MPQLDVSFMTLDLMLADLFDVRRRISSVGSNGRVNQHNDDQLFQNISGVITIAESGELERGEDASSQQRVIEIITIFQLIPAAPGYQPDEVIWNNAIYTVKSCEPYARYGNGTYEATAEYRSPVPLPQ